MVSTTEKYNHIEQNIESQIVWKRFSGIAQLNKILKREFEIKASKSGLELKDLEWDYSLLAPINSDWGYVDIYYLKWKSCIYITEVNVSEE